MYLPVPMAVGHFGIALDSDHVWRNSVAIVEVVKIFVVRMV